MFAAYCPRHECTVLVSVYDVDAMQRDDKGFNIHFTCQCGYRGWQRQPRSQERLPTT